MMGTLVITGSANTIDSTTGTALEVTNTTIGAGGLTFRSISSNGGTATGIILDTTGIQGGLTVTGAGTPGSGGTIAIKSGADGVTTTGTGISLNNTRNVSLAWMQLNDFQNFAIRGSNVTGFSLTSSVISGTNDGIDEGSIAFDNLLGLATITNSNIGGGLEDNFRVINTTGTLNRITFTNVTIGANSTGMGDNGILVEAQATAVVRVTVDEGTFTSTRGDHIQINALGTSNVDFVLTDSVFSNNHPNVASGGGGIRFTMGAAGSSAAGTFTITGNTFRDSNGTTIGITEGLGNGSLSGTISGNTIGMAGVGSSGSAAESGISLIMSELGSLNVTVTNNTIREYANHGIIVQTGGTVSAGNGSLTATIQANTIHGPVTNATAPSSNGIHVNAETMPGGTYQVCLVLGGSGALANSIVGSGADNGGLSGSDFRLQQRQNTTIRLPGYTGANNSEAAVVAFVQGNNSSGGTPTGLASHTAGSGGGFVGGSCT